MGKIGPSGNSDQVQQFINAIERGKGTIKLGDRTLNVADLKDESKSKEFLEGLFNQNRQLFNAIHSTIRKKLDPSTSKTLVSRLFSSLNSFKGGNERLTAIKTAIEGVLTSSTSSLVDAAASVGDLNRVTELLNACTEMPDLTNAMKEAASGGHLDVVKFLFSKGLKLLSQGSISETELITAIEKAASHGHLDVVRFLFSKGIESKNEPLFKDQLLYKMGDAVCSAAAGGHRDVVQFLLFGFRTLHREDYSPIPDDKLKEAMVLAASRGHDDMVNLLFRAQRFFEDNVATLISATEKAVRNGHLDVVKFLSPKIPQGEVENMMNLAVSLGKLNIVKSLVSHLGGNFDLTRAKATAKQSEHSEIIDFFKNGRFGDKVP